MIFISKVLLGIVICLWICILWSRRKFYVLSYKMRAAWGYPLIGVTHKILNLEDILNTFEDYVKKFGNFFLIWKGPIPLVVTSDPQICQDVLNSPYCVNKPFEYDMLKASIGPGLFSLKNPEWSRHRKLLNPLFSHGILLSFLHIFNNGTDELIKIFDGLAKTDCELDLNQTLFDYSMGIATHTTMGSKISMEQNSESKRLLNNFQKTMDLVVDVLFSPFSLIKTSVYHYLGLKTPFHEQGAKIKEILINLINEQSADDLNKTIDRTNKHIFIQQALELLQNKQFTLDEILIESANIIFAAFDTTAKTIHHTLILLAMHPEYQEQVFDEIKSIIPELGTSEVAYDDIKQMRYLEMIINESMRLIPPVVMVSRETTSDVKLTNGTILPKRVHILIHIYYLHRNENVWGTKAHLFNPDNFLSSNLEKRHRYAFIPFTRGIRSCIGIKYAYLSMTVALAKLIRNYRFETSFKFEDLDGIQEMAMGIKKKPLLKLTKRIQ